MLRRRVEVGVLGGRRDDHAERVVFALEARGARVIWLDLADFPFGLPLSLDEGVPRFEGRDLREVRAWYVRSVHMRYPFFEVDLALREGRTPAEALEGFRRDYAAERERQSFFAGLLLALERAGVAVVNPIATLDQHFVKVDQLAILRAAGVATPRSLATNDPRAVRRFFREVGGRAVTKPLAGGDLCRRVAPGDLRRERLASLLRGPVLLQEEAPGTNVRIFVAGGRAVAAYEIESDELDFRGHEKAVRPIRIDRGAKRGLDPRVREAAERAAAACGMSFTGIDIRLDGPVARARGFAVLEANPSPMFAGFERSEAGGGRPVTAALCDYLLRSAGNPKTRLQSARTPL